jgi:hypothetical protein
VQHKEGALGLEKSEKNRCYRWDLRTHRISIKDEYLIVLIQRTKAILTETPPVITDYFATVMIFILFSYYRLTGIF